MPASIAMVRTRAAAAQAYLEALTQNTFATSPATAQANVRFVPSGGPGGAVQKGPGTTPSWTTQFTWLLSGAAADYEVRVTTASGTGFAGEALATWLGLGSTREWRLVRASPDGITTGTADVEIRRVSDSVVIAGPVVFTLTAERGV